MRTTESQTEKFPLAMRLLHWSMALLIVGLITIGIYMAGIPLEAPDKFDLYHWHRAFGVLVFLLVFVRLYKKVTSKLPVLPAGIPQREKLAAKSVQVGLYLGMLSIPVLGYLASSALPEFPGIKPLTNIWFFGLELPLAPVEKDYDFTKLVIGIHAYAAYTAIGLLLLHIAGAIKHRFFDTPENDVLSKML